MPSSITTTQGLPDAKGKCEAQRNAEAKRSLKQPEEKLNKVMNDESPK